MEKENNRQFPKNPNKKATLRNARRLRKNQTDAEQCLWQRLRGRSLAGLKFRRQHPIGPYICDFVCVDQKLIIEIDGGQHTSNREKDAARTAYLQSQGFRVVRFWNHEVLAATEAVLEKIEGAPVGNRVSRHENPAIVIAVLRSKRDQYRWFAYVNNIDPNPPSQGALVMGIKKRTCLYRSSEKLASWPTATAIPNPSIKAPFF